MVFRDDMEALRARNEALEVEIGELRVKVEELDEAASERDLLKERLHEREAEISVLRGQLEPLEAARTKWRRWVAIGGTIIGVAFLVVFASLMGEISEEAQHGQQLWLAEQERADREARLRAALEEDLSTAQQELESARAEVTFLEREHASLEMALGEAREEPLFDPIVRPGRVVSATGQAPVRVGSECTVEVVSHHGDHNCRVVVICDSVLVYGEEGQGYNTCNIRDDRPTYAREVGTSEDDGDPMFELDLTRRRVVISDGATADSVDYTLEVALRER